MKNFTIPKHIEVELYVNLYIEGAGAGKFHVGTMDRAGADWDDENINVLKVTKKINLKNLEIDDNSIKSELAEQYRKQIKDIQAEAYKKEKQVQDKLDNLLALEYQPDMG